MGTNGLNNKFDLLSEQIQENVDMLMIFETKIDDNFPIGQFEIRVFNTLFRLDRDKNGGGILFIYYLFLLYKGVYKYIALVQEPV